MIHWSRKNWSGITTGVQWIRKEAKWNQLVQFWLRKSTARIWGYQMKIKKRGSLVLKWWMHPCEKCPVECVAKWKLQYQKINLLDKPNLGLQIYLPQTEKHLEYDTLENLLIANGFTKGVLMFDHKGNRNSCPYSDWKRSQ